MIVTALMTERIKCSCIRQQVLVDIVVDSRGRQITATLNRNIGSAAQQYVIDRSEVVLSSGEYGCAKSVCAISYEVVVSGVSSCGSAR